MLLLIKLILWYTTYRTDAVHVRTRGNEYKPEHKRFLLNTRKSFSDINDGVLA